MKKDRFGNLAHDISSYVFDLDPFCGQTEEECMIETATLLYEDPAAVANFLNECAENEDLPQIERAVAETLLQRIATIKGTAEKRAVLAYSTGGGFYEAIWKTENGTFQVDSEYPACIQFYATTDPTDFNEENMIFTGHYATAPVPASIYETMRSALCECMQIANRH